MPSTTNTNQYYNNMATAQTSYGYNGAPLYGITPREGVLYKVVYKSETNETVKEFTTVSELIEECKRTVPNEIRSVDIIAEAIENPEEASENFRIIGGFRWVINRPANGKINIKKILQYNINSYGNFTSTLAEIRNEISSLSSDFTYTYEELVELAKERENDGYWYQISNDDYEETEYEWDADKDIVINSQTKQEVSEAEKESVNWRFTNFGLK